jgi:hypothetical protein
MERFFHGCGRALPLYKYREAAEPTGGGLALVWCVVSVACL